MLLRAWGASRRNGLLAVIGLFWLLTTTACVSSLNSRYTTQLTENTTIYLVRHAEKSSDGKDPELTEVGHARARKLAAILRSAQPDHLWSSNYNRTRQTLAPLALASRVSVAIYDAGDSANLVTRILALDPGNTHVIAGHSNTVPELLDLFEASANRLKTPIPKPRPHLEHSDYSRLYVVTIDVEGQATVQERAY